MNHYFNRNTIWWLSQFRALFLDHNLIISIRKSHGLNIPDSKLDSNEHLTIKVVNRMRTHRSMLAPEIMEMASKIDSQP